MKKAVCILLSLCLLVCSCVIGAFANEEPDLSFAVASDLHYNIPREVLEGEIDDPIYWYANRRCAMEDESGFIIDEFLKQCGENDEIEFVLLSGDLTAYEPDDWGNALLDVFEKYDTEALYGIGNHDARSISYRAVNPAFSRVCEGILNILSTTESPRPDVAHCEMNAAKRSLKYVFFIDGSLLFGIYPENSCGGSWHVK